VEADLIKLKEEVNELHRLQDKYMSDVEIIMDADKKLKVSNEIFMSNVNLLESVITGIETTKNNDNVKSTMKLEQAAILYSTI
jgi:hypothetical protein